MQAKQLAKDITLCFVLVDHRVIFCVGLLLISHFLMCEKALPNQSYHFISVSQTDRLSQVGCEMHRLGLGLFF